MATNRCYTQSGRVLSLDGDSVRVGFDSKSACGSCQARSKCGMVESTQREVVVRISENQSYKVGDQVSISIGAQMGVLSVVVAYLIPLILLMVALVVALSFGASDGEAALITIGVVALYYIVVYFNRNRLEKQIKFTIENK